MSRIKVTMSGSGMSEEQVAEALSALAELGADTACPSCHEIDWSGWETGGIPRVLLGYDEPAPRYLEERLDPDRNLIDWAHGIKVFAFICNRCGYLRLHAPTKLGRPNPS